jgi:multiple sugar transport system substrate-binding protein
MRITIFRRGLLGASTLALVLGTVGAGAQTLGGKVTYWGGLIFSDEANALVEAEAKAWGEANGVEVEVVMINQNETIQRVSAAVEAGTMPDVLDLSLDFLVNLGAQDVFVPLDDVYAQVGAENGGWFEAIDTSTDTTAIAGSRVGVPFGASGNMILRRNDLTTAAGFTEAPATWAELVEQATAVTGGTVYGLGLALSNVGDANVQVQVLQAHGGRLAQDDGRTVAIDSPETRAYLTWLKDAWDRGLFPPGVTTWDGAGDNQAYLSGLAAFIANTGSVGIAARNDDPELFEATRYSPLPAGPVMTVSPIQPQLRAVPRTSENPDAAKALIAHLGRSEFMAKYLAVAIYAPVLQDYAKAEAYNGSSAIHSGLLGLIEDGTAPGYPDVYNQPYAEALTTFVIPKMAQRVVVDGWDFDRAIDEAEAQLTAIYGKY